MSLVVPALPPIRIRYRPEVDVEAVGTGEVWLGQEAVELRLADEVCSAKTAAGGHPRCNYAVFVAFDAKNGALFASPSASKNVRCSNGSPVPWC